MAKHLIVCEFDGAHIKKSTLCALSAAKEVGGDIEGLVMSDSSMPAADAFKKYVTKVHQVNSESLKNLLAELASQVIVQVVQNHGITHVWAGTSVLSKETLPRVAAALGAGMASDISDVVDQNTFKRPMWAGDITGTVAILSDIKVVTVRGTEFEAAEPTENGEVSEFKPELRAAKTKFISFDAVKSERPELSEARVVVSGGRGLKGPEGFKELVEPLADKLNAAIGASRAVCDAGWVPNDWQVGQTGKVVAPELYFALGISGAIQHVAGMKGSKVIVAINKDPEAPIFQVADYGLVADVFEAVPEILKSL